MKRKLPINSACRESNSLSAVLEREYQNVPRETICEALWSKLKLVPVYQKQVFVDRNELWQMFMLTGTSLKRIIAVLNEKARTVYFGDPEEYEPDGEYYYTEEAGLIWSYGKGGCLALGIKDRSRLEGFLKSGQGMKFSTYPHKKQIYKDIVFDLTTGEIFKADKIIARFELGTDYEKLIRILLENRGRNFSYAELAEVLGQENLYQKNRFDVEKGICNKFSRLNLKCGEKVFQCNNGYFVEV